MIPATITLSLLVLAASPPAAGRVAIREANIHAGPSVRSPIIGFAHRGSELAIQGCVPDCEEGRVRWYVLAPRGAVRAATLSTTATADELPAEEDDYLYARVLARAPLREWPSEEAPVVGTLEPHRSVALVADASAPEGWLRYRKGGWVLASALRLDLPSSFGGELEPALPVAFLPDTLRLGTREDRVVIAKQSRFGAVEVGAREVIASGWRLPRDRVRIAYGRRRPRDIPQDGRWVHVDLSEQVLTAYEGDRPVFATLISSGKPGHESRPGQWHLLLKVRHDRMHGRDYDLEEVPWSQYFYDDQALHGTFWHDRFGHRLTHGCINLSIADARWLFEWTSPDVPEGWHAATSAGGLPATTVLVESRIDPADRLRALRAPGLTTRTLEADGVSTF